LRHGWTYVGGIANGFNRHGYCSNDPWINPMFASLMRQGTTEPDSGFTNVPYDCCARNYQYDPNWCLNYAYTNDPAGFLKWCGAGALACPVLGRVLGVKLDAVTCEEIAKDAVDIIFGAKESTGTMHPNYDGYSFIGKQIMAHIKSLETLGDCSTWYLNQACARLQLLDPREGNQRWLLGSNYGPDGPNGIVAGAEYCPRSFQRSDYCAYGVYSRLDGFRDAPTTDFEVLIDGPGDPNHSILIDGTAGDCRTPSVGNSLDAWNVVINNVGCTAAPPYLNTLLWLIAGFGDGEHHIQIVHPVFFDPTLYTNPVLYEPIYNFTLKVDLNEPATLAYYKYDNLTDTPVLGNEGWLRSDVPATIV